MTFILVLLGVIGVIVGNLLWLRPSAQEKALMAQREYAKSVGFQVLLRVAPDWLALPVGERLVAHYYYRFDSVAYRGRWRWHAGLGNWQLMANAEALLQPSPWPVPAPTGWLGIDVEQDAMVLYWREDGEKASIDTILSCLQALGA